MRTKDDIDQDYTKVCARLGDLYCQIRTLEFAQDKLNEESRALAESLAAEKKITDKADLLEKGEVPNDE